MRYSQIIFTKSDKRETRSVFTITDSYGNAIHIKRGGTMLEKLMQAALITFLLQIIAVLSNTNSIQPKVVSPFAEMFGPVISSNFRVSE